MRAGFSSGNVIRALKRFATDPELLDSFEPPIGLGHKFGRRNRNCGTQIPISPSFSKSERLRYPMNQSSSRAF